MAGRERLPHHFRPSSSHAPPSQPAAPPHPGPPSQPAVPSQPAPLSQPHLSAAAADAAYYAAQHVQVYPVSVPQQHILQSHYPSQQPPQQSLPSQHHVLQHHHYLPQHPQQQLLQPQQPPHHHPHYTLQQQQQQQQQPRQQQYAQRVYAHQTPANDPVYHQHTLQQQQAMYHAQLVAQQQQQQHQHQQQQHQHQHHAFAHAQQDRERERVERLRRLRQLRKEFFEVPLVENKYSVQQIIGEGASGVVCSALDNETGETVAVKRVSRGFDKVPVSVRLLRELKFLRLLRGHENIVEMKSILLPSSTKNFDDVFLVFELMPTDLNHVLRSQTQLTALHIQYFTYQLLRGIYFLHSAGVFHRDLKPNNILVSEDCSLRICDFGLARAAFDDELDMVYWTDYVATRWYRAPELIMTHFTKYSTAIDVWSVGCILAEMLGKGKPLFPGKDGYDQLQLMTSVLGSPTEEAISKVQSARVREHFRQLPKRRRRPFAQIYPDADPNALSLLEWLLQFDPAKRPTALEALSHPYLSEFFLGNKEPIAKPVPKQEFAFEHLQHTPEAMRKLFLEEIMLYHPEHSKEFLQGFDRNGGFDLPSQADTFASAMRNMQEGIAQRKTTSMPKHKFRPLLDAYRAKREAQRKKSSGAVGEDSSENATMTDVGSSSSGRRERGNFLMGSSASWCGGPSRRNEVEYHPRPVLLHEDPFASDDTVPVGEELGIVRVNSGGIGSVGPSDRAHIPDVRLN